MWVHSCALYATSKPYSTEREGGDPVFGTRPWRPQGPEQLAQNDQQ